MHASVHLDYRFNTLAEEYGAGSRCINHGTSQSWTVNGKTISDTGGGCYKVRPTNYMAEIYYIYTLACSTVCAHLMNAVLLQWNRLGDQCAGNQLHLPV